MRLESEEDRCPGVMDVKVMMANCEFAFRVLIRRAPQWKLCNSDGTLDIMKTNVLGKRQDIPEQEHGQMLVGDGKIFKRRKR